MTEREIAIAQVSQQRERFDAIIQEGFEKDDTQDMLKLLKRISTKAKRSSSAFATLVYTLAAAKLIEVVEQKLKQEIQQGTDDNGQRTTY